MFNRLNQVSSIQSVDPSRTASGASGNAEQPNSIMSIAAASEGENPISTKGCKIAMAVAEVAKKGGPASGLANNIQKKVASIMKSYSDKLLNLNHELEALQGNNKLSKEELQKKLEEIKKKIDAIQKEGEQKLEIISKIASKIPTLDNKLKTMAEKNIPADGLTKFFDELINNIDSCPSNFDSKGSENDINDKIKKGTLGASADAKFDKEENRIKTKLQELDTKNYSAKPEEKDKIILEKEMLNMELTIIEEMKAVFVK